MKLNEEEKKLYKEQYNKARKEIEEKKRVKKDKGRETQIVEAARKQAEEEARTVKEKIIKAGENSKNVLDKISDNFKDLGENILTFDSPKEDKPKKKKDEIW